VSRPYRRLTPRRVPQEQRAALRLADFLEWKAARFETSAEKCRAQHAAEVAATGGSTYGVLRGQAIRLRRRAGAAGDELVSKAETDEYRRHIDSTRGPHAN
jgi:hypothetical protein